MLLTKLFSATVIMFLSTPAQSELKKDNTTLKHFTPGEYLLKDGEEKLCGEGFFSLRDNGTNIEIGPFHGFDTTPKKETLQGDAPGESLCVYNAEDRRDVKDSETELTFIEVKKCNDVEIHRLTKRAFIEKDKINVTVVKIGKEPSTYNCYWELKK